MTFNNRGAEAAGRGDARKNEGRAKARAARPRKRPANHPNDQPLPATTYLAVGGVLLFVSVLLLLLYIYTAHLLTELGIELRVYYVLLLLLGLACAVLTFGGMRSRASYVGVKLPGRLKLMGPITAVMLFVMVGLYLTGSAQGVNVVVRLVGEDHKPVVGVGHITARVGQYTQTAPAGPGGEVEFKEIPRRYANMKAEIIVAVEGYETIEQTPATLSPVITVKLRRLAAEVAPAPASAGAFRLKTRVSGPRGEIIRRGAVADDKSSARRSLSEAIAINLTGAARGPRAASNTSENDNRSPAPCRSEISAALPARAESAFAPAAEGCTAETIRLRRC